MVVNSPGTASMTNWPTFKMEVGNTSGLQG